MKRVLTQAEADLLHRVYQTRMNIWCNLTREEFMLLIDLSREFERPEPTDYRKRTEFWVSPIRKLLAADGPVDKAALAKALHDMGGE